MFTRGCRLVSESALYKNESWPEGEALREKIELAIEGNEKLAVPVLDHYPICRG